MSNIAVATIGHRRLHRGVYIGIAHDNKKLECINAHCWVIEPALRKVLVQKRSLQDGCYSGLLDISLAGHVDEGETPYEAIVREGKEEGGFDLAKFINHRPKKIIFSERASFNHKPFLHNQQAFVFIATLRLDKIMNIKSNDSGEVESFKLIDFEYFKKAVISRNRQFAPHPKSYYSEVIKSIESVIGAYERTA